MKVRALVLLGVVAACGQTKLDQTTHDAGAQTPAEAGDGAEGGAAGEASASAANANANANANEGGEAGEAGAMAALPPASPCATDTQDPPTNLVCTGLYADIASKQLALGVEAYAPAVALWSDGAEKQRWILLPAGKQIDNSVANEWVFPVGTKVWKEFKRAGRRIETRMWHKTDTDYWVSATYAWNRDESAAQRSGGGDIPLGDGTYHIPTSDECTDCHRGRTDRILGFDQLLLGLAGSTGLNLERLIAEKRLSNPPKSSALTIGDDGTGLAAPALAWLHVNCGTTCHNRNSNAKAWSTGLFMRLDPTLLDGRAVNDFDTLKTTIGIAAVTPAWQGQTRITAHHPANSLLYYLITHRGKSQQMPPIASNVVDAADVPLVEAWIAQMAAQSGGAGSGGSGGVMPGFGGAGGRGGAHGGSAGFGGSAGKGGASGGAGSGGDVVGGLGGVTTGGGGDSATTIGGSGGGDATGAGYGGVMSSDGGSSESVSGGSGGDGASGGYGGLLETE